MAKKITCLLFCLLWFIAAFPQSDYDKAKVSEYLQNQQYDEVLTYLLPLASRDSANPGLLNSIGYAMLMNEQAKNASAYFERTLLLDSANTMSLYYLSKINAIDSPEKAAVFMTALIRLQPTKALWRRSMGDLLRREKFIDSALKFYQEAYLLMPADYRNAAAFGEILIDKKEYQRADSILSIEIRKDSLNATILKLQVSSAYGSGHFESAIVPGERLMRSGDVYIGALKELALSYYTLKKYKDCVRVCEYMLQHQIESASIYYYEAMAYAHLKEFKQSNDLLKICLDKSISKEAETYFYQIAINKEELKLFRKAIANYDTAFYLFRTSLMKYYCGRICEVNLHDMKLAQKYYREYLALGKPSSTDEKRVYAYVKSVWGDKTINRKSSKNSVTDTLFTGQ
jgi:hypothetical protein